jgi:hypothetical protein
MLGSVAVRLLEHVPEIVAMLALERVPHMALGQHTNSPLASLAAGLGLYTLALPPQWGLGREISGGR